jgi:thiol-disulfide isomerase/thioredoxin
MNNSFLYSLTAALALGLAACSSPSSPSETTQVETATSILTPGPWRGVLAAQGQEIPFLFEVKTEGGKPVVYLINKGLDGEERLRCDEISTAGDSTTIRMHVFDAALVVRGAGKDKLKGTWVKYDGKEPYRVPLTATAGEQELFLQDDGSDGKVLPRFHIAMLEGAKYKTVFQEKEGGTYEAVALIKYDIKAYGDNTPLRATFLTTTGDYRYLAGGIVMRNKVQHLLFSTFDGSHAFLFDGILGKESLSVKGDFYSGKSGHETWTATLDPKAKLPDANTLTGLKPGQTRLDFKFPNIYAGGSISPTDPKYTGKVVVVQILGSWCPNCMDETNFLAPWYEKNKQRGVEIIGLGYERTADHALASAKLVKMRERMKVGYDVALAGLASAADASKSLPQLKGVLAFPTTIFLDKKGNVRKVHTGFSGPGTGKYYQAETAEFERTVDALLKE